MYDFVIVGGGIVGISTAWQLQRRYPNKKILLLEKESRLACHQTGRNSGVIHAGVYYQPGSLKAKFCKRGADETIAFCREHAIPYEQCGKLLVATDPLEMARMQHLRDRCEKNEIEYELLDDIALKQREPNVTGLGALFVSKTGIVDYRSVTEKMAELFQGLGGDIRIGSAVIAMRESPEKVDVTVQQSDNTESLSARFVITCGGLMSDRLTKMLDIKTNFQIIPFRGEYYRLAAKHNDIVNHLIYPIPDPALPFLGVHLTRMVGGYVTVGPNAVLGWKREGYDSINFDVQDAKAMLGFPGFWKVAKRNLGPGLQELRDSFSTHGYLQRVKKYCPQLRLEDLLSHPVGVRAQAVLRNGELVHDFLFAESPRSLHVCNAPSPAATSAIPIGAYICDKLTEKAAGR